LFEQSKFGEAFEKYARALQLQPDDPLLHLNSGDALYRQKNFAEAREEFAKAAAGASPRIGSAAHYNSGNAFLREQNRDSAIEEYKNALRCDPSNALAKRNLEIALKAKQQPPPPKQLKQKPSQQKQPQSQRQKKPQQPQQQPAQPRPAQATPMTPEEARALLRQAQYEDAKLRREIVRPVPPTREKTGKQW
jgi:tetratricopeptide (TPR) repeat protein